jgi:hypothetical protein
LRKYQLFHDLGIILKAVKKTAKAAKQTVKTAKWKTNTAKAEVRPQNETGAVQTALQPFTFRE